MWLVCCFSSSCPEQSDLFSKIGCQDGSDRFSLNLLKLGQ